MPGRTALVVSVPRAEHAVASFRARFDARWVARRIPPHVTVLFPFVPADDIGRVDDALRAHARPLDGFDASLDRVGCFEEHVWLRPGPEERWRELVAATTRRFPELPPYEGVFDTVVPHLTVGEATEDSPTRAMLEVAQRELAPALPLRFRADALSLLAEGADGSWSPAALYPFG